MAKRQKPDRPLRLVMVGCGRASRAHLKAISYFEKRGFLSLEGLVDRDRLMMEEVLKNRGPRLPQPHLSHDAETLFRKFSFDIAVIATPPPTHGPIAMRALEAGLHLVIEKPLTLDLDQADQLISEAKARERILAVGMKYRYFPGVGDIRALIQGGFLGEVLYGVTSVRWGHDQSYYDQAAWFGTWEAEGGALMNQSIHGLDLMAYLMDARPLEATAVLARQCHDMEAADLVSGILTLEGNRYLLLEGTTKTDAGRQEASFFLRCEKGTVRAGFAGGHQSVSVKLDQGRELANKLILKAVFSQIHREGMGIVRQMGNPYTFLYADLLDAITEKRPPVAPGEAGRESLASALALLQSGKEKRTVTCPPSGFHLREMTGLFDQA